MNQQQLDEFRQELANSDELSTIVIPIFNIFANINKAQLAQLIQSSLIFTEKEAMIKEMDKYTEPKQFEKAFNRLFFTELYTLYQLIEGAKQISKSDPEYSSSQAKRTEYEQRVATLQKIQSSTPNQ